MDPAASLGPLRDAVAEATPQAMAVVPRMWQRDHTVWQDDPEEVTDRLGWLDAPDRAVTLLPRLRGLASEVVADGVTDVLLVGMGGSSLFPRVLADVFAPAPGHPRLHVLDSTDPRAVLATERSLPWATTLLVPASKSGTTLEVTAHLKRFLARLVDARGRGGAGHRVVPVTDPGTPLEARATREGFRAVVHGDVDVGGRFSALTAFGLLPAALLGLDLEPQLAGARAQLDASRSTDPAVNGPAVLGATLAAAVRAGRDKLTLVLPDEIAVFGAWVEQLVAESTGKHGVGILPVLERAPDPARYGTDRLVVFVGDHSARDAVAAAGHPVVDLPWSGPEDLGGEVARWELATAVAGALLGINPFDQPDVAAAKQATQRVLDGGDDLPETGDPEPALGAVAEGGYAALLGFVTPDGPDEQRLHAAAERLRSRLRVPVTVGIGPRYLHSTGQLHKGGPPGGVFLVVVGDDPEDAEIPTHPFSFSRLKRAQAAGDIAALRAVGRTVVHVDADRLDDL